MTERVRKAAGIAFTLAMIACGTTNRVAPLQAYPWGPDSEGRWGATRVVEELRLGVATGPDEFEFGHILHAAVGHDGTILVADETPPLALRAFDARGNFLRWIGRARRPSERAGGYRWINGIETLPDGRFVVWDVSSDRVSILSEDGSRLGGFLAHVSVWTGTSYDLEVDLEGNVYVRAVRRIDTPTGSGAAGAGSAAPQGARFRDGADRSIYLPEVLDRW